MKIRQVYMTENYEVKVLLRWKWSIII